MEIPKIYYTRIRYDLLKLLAVNVSLENVLDVGCGAGATGEVLKKKFGAKNVTGLEINREYAKKAEGKIDRIIISSVDADGLPFHQSEFDLILMGDILEHLIDPWTTLSRYREFLKPGGILLASIPNIQHWRTVLNLLMGKWEYKNWGTLDKSHLRFFTISSIRELFTNAGFKISKIDFETSIKGKIINMLTLGIFRNFIPFKFLILAYKK